MKHPLMIRLELCKTAAELNEYYEFYLFKQFPTIYHSDEDTWVATQLGVGYYWHDNSLEFMGSYIREVVYWGA
jgi:hypothetical protein